ncbi:DUF3616 domain-containing protein [Geminicoccus flavidas]|uniref:DUF3616 domain-containing protein n=1 Tax=Geminicoccus flavidas TaxID=2506407 RepID=UPI0013571326|nr:DUF3616 domain-containing protein [Geminicoccus flavidas]
MAEVPAGPPFSRVKLALGGQNMANRADKARSDLSAVAFGGGYLWLATDEGAMIERLRRIDGQEFGEHQAFDLTRLLKLPVGKEDPEIDVEGLAVDGDHLWVAGSHSFTRDKPDLGENSQEEALDELADIDRNPNRRILACIPLALLDEAGRAGEEARGAPMQAARLRAGRKRSALLDVLRDDRHLAPFMEVPAKENGFDIEGVAVQGERVMLGLRGPVLRGWAIILEVRVKVRGDRLKLGRLGPGGLRYRKHFLDLDGCGIRELCWLDGDLLVLAGPTMDLDGPVRLHRWAPPGGEAAETITGRDGCPAVLDLPAGSGCDHAEGATVLEGPDGPELLVVYDSPAEGRLFGARGVHADLVPLPRRS